MQTQNIQDIQIQIINPQYKIKQYFKIPLSQISANCDAKRN